MSNPVETGWDLEANTQDQNGGIEWSDPPKTRGSKASADTYRDVAAALKDRPGHWAKIAANTKNTSLVAQIKQGKIDSFKPEGSFEATGRRTDDGDLAVWARYVGQ